MPWKQLKMFPIYSIMSGFYLLRGKLPPLPPKTFQVINVLLSIVSIHWFAEYTSEMIVNNYKVVKTCKIYEIITRSFSLFMNPNLLLHCLNRCGLRKSGCGYFPSKQKSLDRTIEKCQHKWTNLQYIIFSIYLLCMTYNYFHFIVGEWTSKIKNCIFERNSWRCNGSKRHYNRQWKERRGQRNKRWRRDRNKRAD